MSDLISRSELLKDLDKKCVGHCAMCEHSTFLAKDEHCGVIDEQPTVEAVPVVRGEWIRVPSSDTMTGAAYKCSKCGKMRYGSFMPNFCQHCGADMRKKV